MLRGYLKYRDLPFDFDRELEVTGNEYTFNVLSAEFPDTLWLNVSYINDTYDALFNANALIHRIVNPKKCDIDYTSKAYGACRIDVGSKIKTNAVNIYFASRIGSAVRYALSIPTRVLENDRGRMTAKFSNDVSSFEVTYECSVPHSLKIHTPYIDMELTKCEDIEDSFRPLKEKDKYGNKPFLTPISLVAVRLSKDFLGFDIERKVEDDIPTWGLYQTIEDVIAANPDKNTSWILDRNYVIVNKDNVDEVLQMFYDYDGLIAFDTETTGLNISFKSLHGEGDVIVGFSLSKDIGHGYYFPLNHVKFDNITDDITFFMQSKVAPILERKKIICHNTSFDWKVAYLYGINTNVVFDTMCAFACTYRYEFGKGYDTGLKSLAKNILGLDMFDLEDFVMGKWGDDSGINFSHLPYELVRRYAPADTDMTLSLYYWLVNNDVLNRYNATKVHDLEVQFQKVVGYSEYWGYHIDIANLPTLIKGIEDNMAEHEHRMFEIAGHEFNPNSPVQLKSIMYDELGIEKIEGNDSTKAELLKELARITDENGKTKYPFVEELLEYRKSEGTYKNFIKKRDNFITNDGFIFPHVYAFGTDTGRVSIKEPNYQSYDKLVKHYITPREGYMHFDCDFSQIEYRTLASMAQQTNLCDAMNDPDMDYHTYQASRMFNIPYASVTPALRSQSKGFNFGLPYGMGDRSLGIRIFGKATPENTAKAAELRKKYFQGQEKIQSFFEVVRAQGVANGYTETWLGRRRYYDKKQFNTAKIRRQAGNHVIQGTAADIYKLGVVSVFDMICRKGWLGKVLINAFVHDEILIEVHKSINPYEFLKCWRQEYEVKIPGFCNLYAGCGFGHNWYEAKTQDLPHQFIQQCIDKADGGIDWDWNTDKFLDELSADYFDYRVKRVADYITDKANNNQVIKPLINTLLGEVTAEKLGVKTKDFNKSYSTLKDKINKFVEVFGITGDIVNIMTAEEAEKSKPTQSNSSQDTSFNVSSMSALEQYISSCLQFGIVVDVENMYVYLRFEQSNPSFMAQVKVMCNPNTGYKLRFVLKDGNSVKLMDTTCYIKYTDIPVLQSAYMAMR